MSDKKKDSFIQTFYQIEKSISGKHQQLAEAATNSNSQLPPVNGCVMLETSIGSVVIDIYGEDCPVAARNFINLCDCGLLVGAMCRRVVRDNFAEFSPTFTDRMGNRIGADFSFDGIVKGDTTERFQDELSLQQPSRGSGRLRINRPGLLLMAGGAPNSNGASFIITLSSRPQSYFEGKCTVFGEVAEGLGALVSSLQKVAVVGPDPTAADGVPVKVIRVKRTHVIHSPFPALPPYTAAAARSNFFSLVVAPSYRGHGAATEEGRHLFQNELDGFVRCNPHYKGGYLSSDDEDDVVKRGGGGEAGGLSSKAKAEAYRARTDRTRELMLKVLQQQHGGGPSAADADGLAAPENVLFVCKLNPITTADSLKLVFSTWGKVVSCEIIKDWKTGQSLQYGFVEFEGVAECNRAYQKMEGVLIDDCRIHVDFCQSVAKVWANRKRGRNLP